MPGAILVLLGIWLGAQVILGGLPARLLAWRDYWARQRGEAKKGDA